MLKDINKAVLAYGKIDDFCRQEAEVSTQRQKKIEAYRFEDDKKRCALSEILLVKALEQIGVYTEEIIYRYNEYGKPYLRDFDNIYFSISHSGVYAVCLVSNNETGIDIEKIKPVNPEIPKRFFTKEEYIKIIDRQKENVDLERFYDCWTKKEAYIKYIGKGLAIPLDSFNVYDMAGVEFAEIDRFDNYKCSVCSKNKIDRITFLELNQKR